MTPLVFLCDHATNHIPSELHGLGLPADELERHIAWDIGAARVAEALADCFDAPVVSSIVSRLVIDCNRHLDAPDSIPPNSDGTPIPGNRDLSEGARISRVERWFQPYHDAIEAILLERERAGTTSLLVSVHSMTESLAGVPRPWQIALSSHRDRHLAERVLVELRKPGDIVVGDNQPYDLDPEVDFTIPFHAMRRNLPYLQVEFRQDEIGDRAGQRKWADRFAAVLKQIV